MSILSNVIIPTDYPKKSKNDPTWIATQSKNAAKLLHSSQQTNQALQITEIGVETFSYMQGNRSTLPLKIDRIINLPEGLRKITSEGLEPIRAIHIIAQTISTVESYKNLYNLIAKNPIKPLPLIQTFLPYNQILTLLANFFLAGEQLYNDLKAWQNSEESESKENACIKFIGSFANTLIYTAQLVAFLFMTQVWIGVQVALSTILYASTIYRASSIESNQDISMKKKIEIPAKISMMV